ncbi:MAG: hypothetical protein LBQ94_01860 [Treponema sp.]|jgi:hypothetical protein|nr:hypothetical protein [Treponema sp.]
MNFILSSEAVPSGTAKLQAVRRTAVLRGKKSLSFCALLLTLLFCACGIEDFPVLPPIPQSNVIQQFNDRATVYIPNDYVGTAFTNFAIYYRIYVSDILQSSTSSESIFSTINPVLAADYTAFKGYIDSTTAISVDMDRVFQGRNYKLLALESNDNILSSSSVFGTNIEFNFSSSRAPTMTAGSNTYTLWRSDGGGLFSPQPDRLFRNREELYRTENLVPTINADVQQPRSGVAEGHLYTYAAMFIVAVGVNPSSYSNIYSTPALIHVFQLPD